MRGRRPKPTYLKLVTGNPGGRPLNRGEPRPVPPSSLAPPAWLSDAAKEIWMSHAPELVRLGVLTSMDVLALANACALAAEVIEADAAVRRVGIIIKSARGRPIPNPYLRVRNKALELLKAHLVEFGLTPSSRSRLSIQPPEGEDAAKRYFDWNK